MDNEELEPTIGGAAEPKSVTPSTVVVEPEVIASLDDLLSTQDLDIQYVALPAPYKGGIRVRPLTMLELRNARKSSLVRSKSGSGITYEVDENLLSRTFVILCVEEPKITPAQYDAMAAKNFALLEAIMQAVNSVNGFSAKAVEGEVDPEVAAEF